MFTSHRLTAWDALQLLTKRFSDQQVRMVVELDGRVDEARLADAVRAVVAAEPVLGCRVQDGFFRPGWKVLQDFDPRSLLQVITTTAPEADIQRLVLEDIDPLHAPIVKFGLLRGERDTLVSCPRST